MVSLKNGIKKIVDCKVYRIGANEPSLAPLFEWLVNTCKIIHYLMTIKFKYFLKCVYCINGPVFLQGLCPQMNIFLKASNNE